MDIHKCVCMYMYIFYTEYTYSDEINLTHTKQYTNVIVKHL